MDFLLINKPEGWTSFDVVAFVRNRVRSNSVIPNPIRMGEEPLSLPVVVNDRDPSSLQLARDDNQKPKRIKVGHAGTLDPFATGLLIVGVGREATKRLDEFKQMPKTYIATIKLGETSDTYDKTGKIVPYKHTLTPLTREGSRIPPKKEGEPLKAVREVLKTFTGKQLQIPPMFSAKKINGQRLYNLARKGIEVERLPNEIEIYEIKLLEYAWPILKIEVQCSAGTYIRSLANDIGTKLGTGAYCQELVRTQIGQYLLTNSTNISDLK